MLLDMKVYIALQFREAEEGFKKVCLPAYLHLFPAKPFFLLINTISEIAAKIQNTNANNLILVAILS